MINVVSYEPGDELLFNHREEPTAFDASWAFTFTKNGLPVAIVGCSDFYPTVGHLWAVVSDDVRGCGVSFTKMARRLLNETLARFEYNRIQAFCDSSNEENKKWLTLLGLEYEATMIKASTNGGNLDIFARIL